MTTCIDGLLLYLGLRTRIRLFRMTETIQYPLDVRSRFYFARSRNRCSLTESISALDSYTCRVPGSPVFPKPINLLVNNLRSRCPTPTLLSSRATS